MYVNDTGYKNVKYLVLGIRARNGFKMVENQVEEQV